VKTVAVILHQQEVVALVKSKSKSIKQTDSKPKFKTKKGNFRDSDFEFDGIIKVKVFWKWLMAMVSCALLLIIIILHHQMIYLSTSQIRLFGLKTGDCKGVVPPKEGEKFSR
jgi:transcription termination factor Rho